MASTSRQIEKSNASSAKTPEMAIDPLVPTVFHEHWWLNAASRGAYEAVEVSESHRVVGRFPYAVRQSLGRRISALPPLTHVLGPAIDGGTGSENTRFLKRYSIAKELISKLPSVHRFRQKLHSGHAEALAFQSLGFRTGVQLTFEIQPQTEADIWNRLRNKSRNVIRRAKQELEVFELNDSEQFVRLYETNLTSRGQEMLQGREEIAAVCQAALQNKAGKILAARDANRRLIAAIFLAYDLRRAYYVMSTRSPDSGNGAISLLIWTAIGFCLEHSLIFDFAGITTSGAVLLYVGFGSMPKPIYIVTTETKRIKIVDSCRSVMGLLAGENPFDS